MFFTEFTSTLYLTHYDRVGLTAGHFAFPWVFWWSSGFNIDWLIIYWVLMVFNCTSLWLIRSLWLLCSFILNRIAISLSCSILFFPKNIRIHKVFIILIFNIWSFLIINFTIIIQINILIIISLFDIIQPCALLIPEDVFFSFTLGSMRWRLPSGRVNVVKACVSRLVFGRK